MVNKVLTKNLIRLLLCLLLILTSLSFSESTFAQSVNTETANDQSSQAKREIEQKIAEYEQKLSEVRTQKNTLSAQLSYMDTQVAITELRVKQTQEKIKQMEEEISVLGARIVNLDNSLNKLSNTLLQRIAAGYKNRDVSLFDLLLDSSSANELINRLKYFDLAREKNQKTLLQVQEAKSNFEEQKDLREKRAEKLEDLKLSLIRQQNELERQKIEKRISLFISKLRSYNLESETISFWDCGKPIKMTELFLGIFRRRNISVISKDFRKSSFNRTSEFGDFHMGWSDNG